MTIEIRCEVGSLRIGDRDIPAGTGLMVAQVELPIELTSDPARGDWRALLSHAGNMADPAINVAVMYDQLLGERYTLTSAQISRFGCSVVIEGEFGDRVLISRASAPEEVEISPAT